VTTGLQPAPIKNGLTAVDFSGLRFGLFIHYGLYSLLERGEWVMNKERLDLKTMCSLRDRFSAEKFDAGAIADLAVSAGMRYLVFTTMHHEGFRLYPTLLSDLHTGRAPVRRDLVGEVVAAARERGLKVGLYHSLNNWYDQPDAVAALEGKEAYDQFMEALFARLEELVIRYRPFDILWYDGWWPFDAEGWQSERMNARLQELCPGLLFNNRNALPGDFGTPEGHLGAPHPYRPWEACLSLNESWGYHRGDDQWKSLPQLIGLLAGVARQRGNLLLNVGPRGDGSLPEPAVEVLQALGRWLHRHGESIYETDTFDYDLRERGEHRGDWIHHGPFTVRGRSLYAILLRYPGEAFRMGGLECGVERVSWLGSGEVLEHRFESGVLEVDLPPANPESTGPAVLKLECDSEPSIYLTGGMRVPKVVHPHYDPCESDILL